LPVTISPMTGSARLPDPRTTLMLRVPIRPTKAAGFPTRNDFRLATRLLAKDSGFTVTAVLVLTIGMASTITIFTLINGAYFRDLPFTNPDRISTPTSRNRTPHPTTAQIAHGSRTFSKRPTRHGD
jgi:hypothetical protein